MKAVIIAAGRGTRLGYLTSHIPKPLITLKEQSLIEYVITSCKKAGINDFLIVTGYKGELIQRKLGEGKKLGVNIKYVSNSQWQKGNATSLIAAREKLYDNKNFILSMSDHIYNDDLINKALKEYKGKSMVCVDRNPVHVKDLEDATKVMVRLDGSVKDIGKKIVDWNYIDTGVFIFPSNVFDILDETVSELNKLMMMLVEARKLVACDVTESPWLDVDTLRDLEYARTVFPL
ncbi:sugar phosphate nucleotidyltransferase [Thermoproteota archaeon]